MTRVDRDRDHNQILIGHQDQGVHVALLVPTDTSAADVDRAVSRAQEVASYELTYHTLTGEESTAGTKYEHLLATDGGSEIDGRGRDLPEPCPSCETPCHVVYQTTDGEHLSCPNPDCPRNSARADGGNPSGIARTEPTDRRGGPQLDPPIKAKCAGCGTVAPAIREVVVCDNCGTWLEVITQNKSEIDADAIVQEVNSKTTTPGGDADGD